MPRKRPQVGDRLDTRLVVAIATPLEPGFVERIAAVDPRLEVLYEPDLLPPARYPNDHRGVETFRRSAEQEERWRAMLRRAEVLFGVPGDSAEGLATAVRTAPRLRWVQGTAAGAGETLEAARLTPEELGRVTFTKASGIHGVQLAEFAILGLLAFTKDLPRLLADKEARRWRRYPVNELRGTTVLIVGLGAIGAEIGRILHGFDVRVVGVSRSGSGKSGSYDEIYGPDRLPELLPEADAVVLALPSTPETRLVIDRDAISRMRRGAIVVNVGRGAVIDEPALVAALADGRLRGAALDVFAVEPLPPESPLWNLPNVLISPHTAALSIRENERIVDLFCDNLRRYLESEKLLNEVRPQLQY